jgi:NAD+ kinase
VTRVLLVGHHQRAEAAALAQATAGWLSSHGHHAWMADSDADALGLIGLASPDPPSSADLLISLGGDGTMLRAVQLLDGAAVPIIGVNVGLLGYLAEVEPEGLVPALERFFAGPGHDDGDWEIEERMMLDAHVHPGGGAAEQHWRALNEGVLEREEPGHTVRLLVSIDGAAFTSYAADGLIVATPTGSTAYSMSARGPVVSPRHRALLLTPVSPHTLFDRSLILDPDESIEMEVIGHRAVVLSIDGQRAMQLHEGDTVRFTASPCSARFVRFGRRRFHQILKTKFGLADR